MIYNFSEDIKCCLSTKLQSVSKCFDARQELVQIVLACSSYMSTALLKVVFLIADECLSFS
jgi:hypothetical protein